jgi:hypothetical protein
MVKLNRKLHIYILLCFTVFLTFCKTKQKKEIGIEDKELKVISYYESMDFNLEENTTVALLSSKKKRVPIPFFKCICEKKNDSLFISISDYYIEPNIVTFSMLLGKKMVLALLIKILLMINHQ